MTARAVAPPDGAGGKPGWDREGRDWPNRAVSRFVASGGLRWHVQIAGDGPAVLLLHGMGAATHSWRGVLPLLAANHRVIAPDLPGHGFTSTPGGDGMTLPGMARSVARLLADLPEVPTLAAGHSAGAAIMLRLALDGGLAVPLVSFNGALAPFEGVAATLFPTLAKALFVNPVVPWLIAARSRSPVAAQAFLDRTGSRIDVAGRDAYHALLRSPGHVAGAIAMMANWDLRGLDRDLPRLGQPLVLAYGDRDATVPPEVSHRTARRVPGARLERLAGLGHLAHEERPDLAAAIIAAAAML